MQAIYDALYHQGLPLKLTGLLVGLWLLLGHGFALAQPERVKRFLRAFPRNDKLGIGMVVFGFAWTLLVWSCMDLGDYFRMERFVQLLLVAACAGIVLYVKEFLAVRSLGFLMILAAAPILTSAFLKEPQSRLLLVFFAYAIAVKGMIWVGLPYLLRDQIGWVLAKPGRFRAGAAAGAIYGLAVIACALIWW